MNKKIKAGMYVRTKKGNISKIDRKVDDITNYYFGCFECDNYINVNGDEFISEYEITNVSYNIIDLIEEHDILKIEEKKGVYTICEVEVFKEPYEKYTFLGVRIDNRPIARKLYELNIKSIVTKEQFKSLEYEVK